MTSYSYISLWKEYGQDAIMTLLLLVSKLNIGSFI